VDLAVKQGWRLKELRRERQTLEDLFVRITEADGRPRAEEADAGHKNKVKAG
jgi:hypothetical protein